MSNFNTKQIINITNTIEENSKKLSAIRSELYTVTSFEEFQLFKNKLANILLDHDCELRQLTIGYKSIHYTNEELKFENEKLENKIINLQKKINLLDLEIIGVRKENNGYLEEINKINGQIDSKENTIEDLKNKLEEVGRKLIVYKNNLERVEDSNRLLEDKLEIFKSENFILKEKKGFSKIDLQYDYTHNTNILNNGLSERASRLYNLVMKIFSSDKLTQYLKSKLGDDFHNKLTTKDVSEDFLNRVELELSHFQKLFNSNSGTSRPATGKSIKSEYQSPINKTPKNKIFVNFTNPYPDYFDATLQKGGKSVYESKNLSKSCSNSSLNLKRPNSVSRGVHTPMSKDINHKQFPYGWTSMNENYVKQEQIEKQNDS
jgi:hypothetical protein